MNFIKNLHAKIKFEYLKRRYYLSLKPSIPNSPEINKVLQELNKTGLVIVPDWLGADQTQKILGEVTPLLDRVKNNQNLDSFKYWRFPEYGVYRLLEADLHSPTASEYFFNSGFINDIARCYLSKTAHSYQRMAEIKPDNTKRSISDDVHFDDWKIRFKAFLYLTDVDETSAPFCYYPRTHLDEKIRASKEFEYFRDGKKGTYGYYNQEELSKINESSRIEPQICVGKTGTLILVDTRGLHSGTPLLNPGNPRVLLASYFDA